MPKKYDIEQDGVTQTIDLGDIYPSPYQHRKIFDSDKLHEFATTGEIYTARSAIKGNRQIYLPAEIQKMLEGSGKIRIQILGG